MISASKSTRIVLGRTPHRDVDKWEIPASKIILEEMLGEGCFGEVHRGIVKGPLPNSHMMKSAICKTVAIKFLKRKYDVNVSILLP